MLSRSRRRSILFAFETHFRRNRERHRTGGGMASDPRQGASAPSDVPQTGRSGGGSGSPSAKTRQATFSGRGNRERSPSSIRSARGTDVGSARCHRRWFRAPARCRSETGAPTWFCWEGYALLPRFARRADQRSAFQAVPALLRWEGWEFRPLCPRCGSASSALVSRSRAMPVGDRRSAVAPSARGRYVVSPRSAGLCRPEVGVPSRPPRFCSSAMRSISRLVRRTLDHLFQRKVLEPPAGRAGIQGHAG